MFSLGDSADVYSLVNHNRGLNHSRRSTSAEDNTTQWAFEAASEFFPVDTASPMARSSQAPNKVHIASTRLLSLWQTPGVEALSWCGMHIRAIALAACGLFSLKLEDLLPSRVFEGSFIQPRFFSLASHWVERFDLPVFLLSFPLG